MYHKKGVNPSSSKQLITSYGSLVVISFDSSFMLLIDFSIWTNIYIYVSALTISCEKLKNACGS